MENSEGATERGDMLARQLLALSEVLQEACARHGLPAEAFAAIVVNYNDDELGRQFAVRFQRQLGVETLSRGGPGEPLILNAVVFRSCFDEIVAAMGISEQAIDSGQVAVMVVHRGAGLSQLDPQFWEHN